MKTHSSHQATDPWPKLDKPALVGSHMRFNIGVSSRLVVEAAQRQFEYSTGQERDSSVKPKANLLEKAIAIATKAHAGQVDKGGAPYILHPLRVMMAVESIDEKIVAVLHDVVEDSGITLQDLAREGFSIKILTAIESVTKLENESRFDAAHRAAKNKIGRVVKIADNGYQPHHQPNRERLRTHQGIHGSTNHFGRIYLTKFSTHF
jgi:HD domain